MITSGTPQFTPNATGSRHGFVTWPAALTIGGGLALQVDDPEAEHVEHRLRVEVRQALAEDLVHRDQQEDLEDGREAARGAG